MVLFNLHMPAKAWQRNPVMSYYYYYYNIFTEDETIQYKNTAINLCPLYKVRKYVHKNIYKYYKMYEK